jgi:hypothetical protein
VGLCSLPENQKKNIKGFVFCIHMSKIAELYWNYNENSSLCDSVFFRIFSTTRVSTHKVIFTRRWLCKSKLGSFWVLLKKLNHKVKSFHYSVNNFHKVTPEAINYSRILISKMIAHVIELKYFPERAKIGLQIMNRLFKWASPANSDEIVQEELSWV